MALKATIYKIALNISDLRRHYYQAHELRVAKHPSESEARMMVRLVAFMLFADERMIFTKGLSTADEPDLWQKSLSDEIEHWIEVGQPSLDRIRKGCNRADKMTILSYGKNPEPWMASIEKDLGRFSNLTILHINKGEEETLTRLLEEKGEWQCTLEDDNLWLCAGENAINLSPVALYGSFAG